MALPSFCCRCPRPQANKTPKRAKISIADIDFTTLIYLLIVFYLLQFYSMLHRNDIANMSLRLKKVTIFAPTNEAFQRYKTPYDDELDKELVLYHMSKFSLNYTHF